MTNPVEAVRAPALEMRGITKRYPGVVANDGIDLDVRPGEIHALLGENGAGKTTLMNVLYGLARPDEGQILLDGQEVQLSGPSDAIARGISMVHQHFMLVPVLTVAENIVLGEETMSGPIFLDRKEAHKRIVALGRQFGFEVDPEAKVGSLSVGWQQRVEILKALYRDARILVLDEPTAVLTPQETAASRTSGRGPSRSRAWWSATIAARRRSTGSISTSRPARSWASPGSRGTA